MTGSPAVRSNGTANREQDRDALPSVVGKIAFVDEQRSVAVRDKDSNSPTSFCEVKIRDARPINDELSFDREGFRLVEHKTAFANERDPERLKEGYLDEVGSFIKDYLGADWVVPRKQGLAVRSAAASSGPAPVGYAHLDYAPIAGPVLAAIENQKRGIEIRPYSRMMIMQAWRALSPPPQDFPLAICDGSTVEDGDTISVQVSRGPNDTAFRIREMRYNAAQRWYYYPNMQPNELLLFKGFDTEVSCYPRAAHGAFDIRKAVPHAKPRESVEARFFVYWN